MLLAVHTLYIMIHDPKDLDTAITIRCQICCAVLAGTSYNQVCLRV